MKSTRLQFIVYLTIFVFLSISVASKVNAMYLYNDPEVPVESEKAVTTLLSTLSNLFKILDALERQLHNEANEIKNKMLTSFKEVIGLFEVVEEKTSTKAVTINQIPSERQPEIMKNLGYMNLAIPNTKKDLAHVATQEIIRFRDFLRGVHFVSDRAQNRQNIRMINEELWRLLELGITISEIGYFTK